MTAIRLPGTPIPAGQPYVVLVEDEVEDEALAQRILKKYRIANHVEWFKDGEEALKALRQRLTAPPSQGRALAESSPLLAKARSQGLAHGHALMPSQDADRPSDAASRSNASPKDSRRIPAAAEASATGRAPEMVLLSYSQPRGQAFEVVGRLRALPGMENVPIALCCRTAEEERQARDCNLPRVASLSKPIGFFKLLECIQRMDMHWLVFAEKP